MRRLSNPVWTGWVCFLSVLFLAPMLSHVEIWAQPLESIRVTSSPNPVGSGARALGMGGAFIAVADDATAASWNPGGLIQLERPEISAVGEVLTRSEDNTFGGHREASGKQSVTNGNLNFLSAAYPFALTNHNMIVSLNYQHLYDFSRTWNFTYASGSYARGSDVHNVDYRTDGGLYAWSLAYALQIIPQLSFGFTLNFWQDGIYQNAWQTASTSTIVHTPPPPLSAMGVTHKVTETNRYSFNGFNANVGLLWNVTDRLVFGAVLKTPFTAGLKREWVYESKQVQPQSQGESTIRSKTYYEDLTMPMSYGIGLAYRFSDRVTVSADVYRTNWQNFVLTDAAQTKISPITNGPESDADIGPTTQARLGAEYLFIKPQYTIPVRAGFFYDPAPAKGHPDNYFGFSLGSGLGIGRFVFDIAYVYRFGRDVGKSLIPGIKLTQDVDEHSLYTSMIIHF
jgi:long-subunit fatty acid transport protein